MQVRAIATILLLVLGLLALVRSAQSQADRIVIDRADAIRDVSLTTMTSLNALINFIDPRVIVERANGLRAYTLTAAPARLQELFELPNRFILQYANANRHIPLEHPPAPLYELARQLGDRIVIENANANRTLRYSYPTLLVADHTPPRISDVVLTRTAEGTIVVWTTDELATSTVDVGYQPDVYANSVTVDLFVQRHNVLVAGLVPGTTYYLRLSSADRSGNTVTSADYTYGAPTTNRIFLPFLRRAGLSR